jgi:hypothetical protein
MDYQAFQATADLSDWFNVRGVALAQPVFWTKGSVTALVALVAVGIFDRAALRSIRFQWWDLPIAGWCLMPAISGIAAGLGAGHWLINTVYQGLVWGVPYLLGRVYLATATGRREFARVLSGIAIVMMLGCLVEVITGPIFHQWLYGFHPHRSDGANRWVGHRALLLLEHGDGVGIWIAAAAMIAWSAWRAGRLTQWPKSLQRTAGIGLPALTVLCQSLGAILLLSAGMAAQWFGRWIRPWMIVAALAVPIVGYGAFQLVSPWSVKQVAYMSLGSQTVNQLKEIPRIGSFAWRIDQEAQQLPQVEQRPVLGHGRWDWWRDSSEGAPWTLWMLVLGQYGALGLTVLFGCLLAPLIRFLQQCPPSTWSLRSSTWLDAGLALAMVMLLGDGLLNHPFNAAFMAVAGGLGAIGCAPSIDFDLDVGVEFL